MRKFGEKSHWAGLKPAHLLLQYAPTPRPGLRPEKEDCVV